MSQSGLGEISASDESALPKDHYAGRITDSTSGPQEVRKRTIAGILLIAVGNSAATLMPPLVALPIFIAKLAPDAKESGLGIALGIYALIAMIIGPVFGAISDRTTSRLGMRKPGLIVGASIIVASLALQGLAANLGLLIAGFLLMAFGSGIFTASFSALIPDSVPSRIRGRVLGFQSLILVAIGLGSTVVGPLLIDNQFVIFTAGGFVMVVTVIAGLALYRDRVLDRQYRSRQSVVTSLIEGFRFDPRTAPDFAWVWVGRFLFTLGISFATGFTIYFMTDQLAIGPEVLPGLISVNGIVGLAATVVGTLCSSFLSDRVRSRKNLIIVSASIMLAGAFVIAFSPSITIFLIGSALINFAVGSFLPTDGALVMDVLPGGQRHVSKYMSIITIADQLPRSIGPLLAPLVIGLGGLTALGGYPVLYLVAGVVAVTGGILVRRVKGAR